VSIAREFRQKVISDQFAFEKPINRTGRKVTSGYGRPFLMGKKKLSRTRESIISSLGLVTKSGKYSLGITQTLKSLRNGEAKLVICANNVAPTQKSVIDYYAMLSNCDVLQFDGDNVDLGTACGKYFRSSVVAIIDPGESEILTVIKEKPE
jgi:large subunit ribosomal protein L30e